MTMSAHLIMFAFAVATGAGTDSRGKEPLVPPSAPTNFAAAKSPENMKEAKERVVQQFSPGGILIFEARYNSNGELNDGVNGEPAVRQFNGSGIPVYIEHYKNGKRNDGVNGEPANQYLHDGKLRLLERYKENRRNDGRNGEPAIQKFTPKGTLISETRYKNDKVNDGIKGEAAVREFNENGTLVYAARFKDNERNDGPNGEFAVQKFNSSGTLIYAERHKEGQLAKVLNVEEIRAYLESQEKQKLKPNPSAPTGPL